MIATASNPGSVVPETLIAEPLFSATKVEILFFFF